MTDLPVDVESISQQVWLHFLKPVELTCNDQKVPMAVLTAKQAREVARRLIVHAERMENQAVEWLCTYGCSIRTGEPLSNAPKPICQKHGNPMYRSK